MFRIVLLQAWYILTTSVEALLNFAREQSPEHLWLYTLQVNLNARAFYEKNGFVAEKLGLSPPPESEPDVEYHWRKSSVENPKS
jgi:ribosomal protein S18 acetylase RimI-like enzyme